MAGSPNCKPKTASKKDGIGAILAASDGVVWIASRSNPDFGPYRPTGGKLQRVPGADIPPAARKGVTAFVQEDDDNGIFTGGTGGLQFLYGKRWHYLGSIRASPLASPPTAGGPAIAAPGSPPVPASSDSIPPRHFSDTGPPTVDIQDADLLCPLHGPLRAPRRPLPPPRDGSVA
jgi:hypothetical protein